MSYSSSLREELEKVLEKRASLDKQLERYTQLFPSKVKFYQDKFGCSEQETQVVLYVSDYILTSTELREMTEEERLDGLFNQMIIGRDQAGTDFLAQSFLAELSQQVVNNLRRHFHNQRNKGFPIQLIWMQIVDSILRDFFDAVGQFSSPKIDLRWIIAQIEGTFYSDFTHKRYEQIIQKLQTKARRPELYYWAGHFLEKRLIFDIDETEYISTTPFTTQAQGNTAFLFLFDENKMWVGSTQGDNSELDNIRSKAKEILSSIPIGQSENGPIALKHYQTFMKRIPMGREKNIFLVIETKGERNFFFILFSAGLDDINLVAAQEMLRRRLVDSIVLTKQNSETIENTLSSWAEHLLVLQTVVGWEIGEMPADIEREKIWALDSVVHARNMEGKENTEILARQLFHEQIGNQLTSLVELNSFLHLVADTLVVSDLRYEILPHEALYEAEDGEDAQYFIFQADGGQVAAIGLQSLFQTSTRFVHRKEEALKRKFIRLKITGLIRRRIRDYLDWIKSSLMIKRLDEELSLYKLSINLREKHAGKTLQREQTIITGISVSERFKALERKKNVQREFQSTLLDFLTKSLAHEIELEILHHPKLQDILTDESFIAEKTRKSKELFHKLVKDSNIRRLPRHVSERVFEIQNSMKLMVRRIGRELPLTKWQDLDRDLISMEIPELEAMVDTLSREIEVDSLH